MFWYSVFTTLKGLQYIRRARNLWVNVCEVDIVVVLGDAWFPCGRARDEWAERAAQYPGPAVVTLLHSGKIPPVDLHCFPSRGAIVSLN